MKEPRFTLETSGTGRVGLGLEPLFLFPANFNPKFAFPPFLAVPVVLLRLVELPPRLAVIFF